MTKKKAPLTPIQKVLLVNGGVGHRLRSNPRYVKSPKKGGRRDDARS